MEADIHMQVAKWGNSLAVRIPSAVVEALDLKEGDQIEIHARSSRRLEIGKDSRREDALTQIRKLRRPLPPGFTFDRFEASSRVPVKRAPR